MSAQDTSASVATPTTLAPEATDDSTVTTSQCSPKQAASTPATPRNDSGHDDSDFEDNITVTVPPAHLQAGNIYRDRHMNGRHGRHHRHTAGMDTPPKNPQLVTLHVQMLFIDVWIKIDDIFSFFSNISTATRSSQPLTKGIRMLDHRHKKTEWSNANRITTNRINTKCSISSRHHLHTIMTTAIWTNIKCRIDRCRRISISSSHRIWWDSRRCRLNHSHRRRTTTTAYQCHSIRRGMQHRMDIK